MPPTHCGAVCTSVKNLESGTVRAWGWEPLEHFEFSVDWRESLNVLDTAKGRECIEKWKQLKVEGLSVSLFGRDLY